MILVITLQDVNVGDDSDNEMDSRSNQTNSSNQ